MPKMPRILLWTWPHIAVGNKQDFNFLVDIVPSFQTFQQCLLSLMSIMCCPIVYIREN